MPVIVAFDQALKHGAVCVMHGERSPKVAWTDRWKSPADLQTQEQVLLKLHEWALESGLRAAAQGASGVVVVLEDVFVEKNVHTSKVLARVQGVVMMAAARLGAHVVFVNPGAWQRDLGLGRRAERSRIKHIGHIMARGMVEWDINEDEADAILIARYVWGEIRRGGGLYPKGGDDANKTKTRKGQIFSKPAS